MGFSETFERLRFTRASRSSPIRIPDAHVLDEAYSPKRIEPKGGYFEIRLSEMFLRDAREYLRSFVPMAVVVTDFAYEARGDSGSRRTLPFLVGSRLLSEVHDYVEGKPVEYLDTKVAGWIPYRGDDIGLFVGLYRLQVGDLVKELLDVLQNIAGTFDVAKVAGYLSTARVLTDGIVRIMGMEEVEFRTGAKLAFSDRGTDHNAFRQGYIAYINATETQLEGLSEHLWVENGRLYSGDSPTARQRFRERDYCLVRIALSETRSDYETLDFHQQWVTARSRLLGGDHHVAHALLIECVRKIAESPDLIPDQQEALCALYYANFQRECERYNRLTGIVPSHAATATRGPKGMLSPREAIQKTVYLAKEGGAAADALRGLKSVSDHWQDIFPQSEEYVDLSSEQLARQLERARAGYGAYGGADPRAVADAIAIAALGAS